MASIPIYPRSQGLHSTATNPLPHVLQTPSGLALLELQGTINLPHMEGEEGSDAGANNRIPIGKLYFPDYHPDTQDSSSTAWMKRVYLYIGQHQRLTGEIKKLPRAIAIVRRKEPDANAAEDSVAAGEGAPEELEVAEIVKYKLVFSQRPEPVGTG